MVDWGVPKSRTPMVMLTEGLLQELRDQVERMGAPVKWRPGLPDYVIDAIFVDAGCEGEVPTEVRTWFRFFDGFEVGIGSHVDILGFYFSELFRSFEYSYDREEYDPQRNWLCLNYQFPWLWVPQQSGPGEPSVIFGQVYGEQETDTIEALWPSLGTMVTDMLEALKVRRYDPDRLAFEWEGLTIPGAGKKWNDLIALDLDPKWYNPDYKGD